MSSQELKKETFFFGHEAPLRARLHFRRTHNNIFVTLTDLSNKVVATMSGGRCFIGNKRPKKAPQVLEPMVSRLLSFFKQHGLNSFEIWLKSTFSWHVQILLKELSLQNFHILSILDKRIIPHNGVRGRKVRRV
jgi:small subunit ribosomal protein S11